MSAFIQRESHCFPPLLTQISRFFRLLQLLELHSSLAERRYICWEFRHQRSPTPSASRAKKLSFEQFCRSIERICNSTGLSKTRPPLGENDETFVANSPLDSAALPYIIQVKGFHCFCGSSTLHTQSVVCDRMKGRGPAVHSA